VNGTVARSCRLLLIAAVCVFINQASAEEPHAKRQFSIAAQSLDAALLEFSEQADLQVLIASELAAGLRSNEVTGRLAPLDALARLIAGNGLQVQIIGEHTVAISSTNTAPSIGGPGPNDKNRRK